MAPRKFFVSAFKQSQAQLD